MSGVFESKKQFGLLSYRIEKALETDAADWLNYYLTPSDSDLTLLKIEDQPHRIMVVGTGGSYSAALAISPYIRSLLCTSNVDVYTPQTALRIMEQSFGPSYDLVIGISYSGRTPDILAVYGLCTFKNYPFLLITGAEESSSFLGAPFFCAAIRCGCKGKWPEPRIVSYFNPEDNSGKEQGYISMFSTLAPVVLFDSITSGKKDYTDLIKQESEGSVMDLLFNSYIARSIKEHPVVHILYEWKNLPAATYLESIFTESGLANVVLHEKKDFSHGRLSVLSQQDFGLVVNLVFAKNSYEEKLDDTIRHLCKEKDSYYLQIESDEKDIAAYNLKMMCKNLGFMVSIGESMNVDISKPFEEDKHPYGEADLYRHESDF